MKTLKLMFTMLIGLSVFTVVLAQKGNGDKFDYKNKKGNIHVHPEKYIVKNENYYKMSVADWKFRIEMAERHGELTKYEYRDLRNEVKELEKMERKFGKDWKISKFERELLENQREKIYWMFMAYTQEKEKTRGREKGRW